jgi:hypothetical protein
MVSSLEDTVNAMPSGKPVAYSEETIKDIVKNHGNLVMRRDLTGGPLSNIVKTKDNT